MSITRMKTAIDSLNMTLASTLSNTQLACREAAALKQETGELATELEALKGCVAQVTEIAELTKELYRRVVGKEPVL